MRKIMEKVLKEMRRIAKGQSRCRLLPVLSVLALTLVIGQAAVAQAVVAPTQPVMVKDINSLQSGTTANAGQFTQVRAITFFTANDGVHGRELWNLPFVPSPPAAEETALPQRHPIPLP
jgi:hypothetical protein